MSIAAWALASGLGLGLGLGLDLGPGGDGPASSPVEGSSTVEGASATADEPLNPAEAADAAKAAGPAPVQDPSRRPATLVFGPDHRGTLTLVDAGGRDAAVVVVRPGERTTVDVPAGRYSVRDGEGRTLATVDARAAQAQRITLPDAMRVASSEAPAPPDEASERPAVVTGRLSSPSSDPPREIELVRRRRWTRWAAPLLSAVVPGAGQALNRQPGRGLAVFTGTVGLALGTLAVWAARDPSAGATPGDEEQSNVQPVVRLGALAGLSAAAGLLYLGQIFDAHAQAAGGRPPNPRKTHVIGLEVARFSTVGFSAGAPAYALYSDWSLAIMGQILPRVTLGLSDVGLKLAADRSMVTVQAGARAAYRFYDRGRVWLAAGGGVLLQGTRADPIPASPGRDPEAPAPAAERAFSAAPYVHFDVRLFLLDRWSLGLMPRVSLPLAARRYRGSQSLPRYATTFELGATTGVYF